MATTAVQILGVPGTAMQYQQPSLTTWQAAAVFSSTGIPTEKVILAEGPEKSRI